MRSVAVLMFLGAMVCISCQAPRKIVVVNPRDPESVLRAYFDAWERGDWKLQKSFMHPGYQGMVPEPVESFTLRVVRAEKVTKAFVIYRVIFDVKVVGIGLSMTTGRYNWTYDLRWDTKRRTWVITNYGAC